MQTPENTIYLNFTKSIVDGFEEFVTSVEKHGNVLGDSDLRCKLKLISKKLQTIFNKWENTFDKDFKSTFEEINLKENENSDVPKKSSVYDDFEFDSMIANSVGDVVTPSKATTAEVSSSTSNKPDFSIFDNLTSPTSTKTPEISKSNVERAPYLLSRKEAEMVRLFEIEKVKKEWIVGSNGPYIEKLNSGSFRCNPCKLEALSYANIISHASGKGHIKKLDNYNRETSATRVKIDTSLHSNLSFLSDVEPELMKTGYGADIIVPFNGFYCNACRGTLNSEEALKLHINGGKHRKNCES